MISKMLIDDFKEVPYPIFFGILLCIVCVLGWSSSTMWIYIIGVIFKIWIDED